MSADQVLHRGADRFVLVRRGSDTVGEHLEIADREAARALLAKLAAEPGNREVLRAATQTIGVPSGFGNRPDENAWAPLTEGLARGSLELVRLIDHPVAPFEVKTRGQLTLSEVSWGETAGIYPSRDHLYQPDRWDQPKLGELLKARAAVTDVAIRNNAVRRARPSGGHIDQMLRPYHCVENFPARDVEITDEVKWFYLSSNGRSPLSHPGTSGTVIVKSYGPFYNIGGGDVEQGDVYLHFYSLDAGASMIR